MQVVFFCVIKEKSLSPWVINSNISKFAISSVAYMKLLYPISLGGFLPLGTITTCMLCEPVYLFNILFIVEASIISRHPQEAEQVSVTGAVCLLTEVILKSSYCSLGFKVSLMGAHTAHTKHCSCENNNCRYQSTTQTNMALQFHVLKTIVMNTSVEFKIELK